MRTAIPRRPPALHRVVASLLLLAWILWIPLPSYSQLGDAITDETALETPARELEAARARLRQVSASGDEAATLEARLDLVGAANATRDLGLAEEQAALALEAARRLGDRRAEGRTLQLRGTTARHRNEYAEAAKWYERAVAIFEELDDPRALGRAYRDLGLALRYGNEFERGLEIYRRALGELEKAGDRSGIGETWNSIGAVLARLGRFEESLEAHRRSLEISRELDQLDGVATSLYNIGDVYAHLGDPHLSREYFEDAHAIDLRLGNPSDVGHSANKLGETWLRLGDLERARDFVELARERFLESEAPRDVAWSESLLGRIALAAGDVEEAREWLDGALAVSVEREAESLEARTRAALAELALATGELDAALDHVTRAVELARVIGEAERLPELYELRTRIHERRGELAEALTSAREERELRDELFDTSRAAAFAVMQEQAESLRREQEVELLRKDRALQRARAERDRFERNVVIVGAGTGLLLFALGYGRLSQRRLNRRLRDEVDDRTRDLVAANAALEELGWSDPLTGARNRRYLEDRLPGLLSRARGAYERGRDGSSGSDLVLFLVDLDRFKQVNDVLGHEVGDAVLRETANRLDGVLRSDDILVRWGGEEFLVVGVGADRSTAPTVAERLRRTIGDRPFSPPGGEPVRITTSVGFAPFPLFVRKPGSGTFDQALGLADRCLYRAKSLGRDAWAGVLDRREVEPPEGPIFELPDSGSDAEPLRIVTSLLGEGKEAATP